RSFCRVFLNKLFRRRKFGRVRLQKFHSRIRAIRAAGVNGHICEDAHRIYRFNGKYGTREH
ncbi:MAG TPA: hypothetical protein PKK52_08655, partial [Syntrophorhabdus sp.]|nr:hypothetical protein [Syntrophorhabdus sp.]